MLPNDTLLKFSVDGEERWPSFFFLYNLLLIHRLFLPLCVHDGAVLHVSIDRFRVVGTFYGVCPKFCRLKSLPTRGTDEHALYKTFFVNRHKLVR